MRLQKEFSKRVFIQNVFSKPIEFVCGADVSYKDNVAYCSCVIVKIDTLEVIESINVKTVTSQPYIPGFLMIRELEPILNALKSLKSSFDLLLIDGHGILHPRKCGLASYIGIMQNIPTIGVAKSLLCGRIRQDHSIEYDGDILGFQLESRIKQKKRSVYVSIGHKIDLETSVGIVRQLIKKNEWLPEPLRIADRNSRDRSLFT